MQGNEKQTSSMEIIANLFWIVAIKLETGSELTNSQKGNFFWEISLDMAKINTLIWEKTKVNVNVKLTFTLRC